MSASNSHKSQEEWLNIDDGEGRKLNTFMKVLDEQTIECLACKSNLKISKRGKSLTIKLSNYPIKMKLILYLISNVKERVPSLNILNQRSTVQISAAAFLLVAAVVLLLLFATILQVGSKFHCKY